MALKSSNQITFTEHKKIVEIKEWYLATSVGQDITIETEGWTTNIQTIDENNRYLWNYEEVIYSLGPSDVSDPIIIGVYSQGSDVKGLSDIKNYYLVTQTPDFPENPEWLETVPLLTPENKYLWNYESIIYTDGTSKNTDPAIIGVYGDSGADAVDFQIYSTNGFEFTEDVESIELKTIVWQHGEQVKSEATYQWKWWNEESTAEDKYENIVDATLPSLTVNKNDVYAFTSLKCVLTYDEQVYEDYVSLTVKTVVYSSVVKFFNGSNAIGADDSYLVAYVELYKDNQIVETVSVNSAWYSENNTVLDGVITTDLSGEYADNDLMYFIYKSDEKEYDVILGVYNAKQWTVREPEYIYKNDLFKHTTSNVFIVPREKITRAVDVNVEVYKKVLDENGEYVHNDNTIVSRTIATVMDLNDPIVSSEAPVGVKEGQLWLDTSVSPSILKMWDGTQWVNSGYQNGGAVYTSRPAKYAKGDLWILGDDETCGKYGPGAILKADQSSTSFDASHWVDAMAENTEVINNVKQYFLFNEDTGLRIGQQDKKFYVNISATEMGFYDNSDSANPDQKVVSIGNKSATIKNIVVNESAEFNCTATFNSQININGTDSNNKAINFVWQIESNGSLSLAIGN